MKTEFSTDLPHFDKILAETWEEKQFIERCLSVSSHLSIEEFSELTELTSGTILNVDSLTETRKHDSLLIDSAQKSAQVISADYFNVKIEKQLPERNFFFFDGDIFQNHKGKDSKSFYSIFSGAVLVSRQENDLFSYLEIFRQVWSALSHSWITYNGKNFPCRTGFSCDIFGEGKLYFSQINETLNSCATYIFFKNILSRMPCFEEELEEMGDLINDKIFSLNDQKILNNFFGNVYKNNPEKREVDIIIDFHRAKLSGDFYNIRSYCRNLYGPRWFKKLGRLTA